MNDFTYALLDCDGDIIRKVRWSNNEYKWYTSNFPETKIIKLDQPKKESDYVRALELVGECLF